jgi:hypothetical protein
MSTLTSEQVWEEIRRNLFAVLGMVTAAGEARTVGIVYVVQGETIYIVTGKDTWKARHIAANPEVSLTIPIAKQIPLLPWIKIPAATITFAGTATLQDTEDASPEILHALFRGIEQERSRLEEMCLIAVTPKGDFVTYGMGVSLLQMRHPEQARGRAPVRANELLKERV